MAQPVRLVIRSACASHTSALSNNHQTQHTKTMFTVKRYLLLVLLALVQTGCEQDTNDCDPSNVTRTRVPSVQVNGDDIVLLCVACETDWCESLGAPCDADGASCTFNGNAGTCQGCCNGDVGELHCGPLRMPIEQTEDVCLPYTETVLPASGLGDLVMLCSNVCDGDACNGFGDPCQSYGDRCDFNGASGVCVGCCNGPTGELHCKATP